MFGSTVLDMAVGLVFLFLAVSPAASAVTEAVASAMKLRHTTLRRGIGALLNDTQFEGLALQLYDHALVNPLAPGTAGSLQSLTRSPAYIPSRNLALALLHILENPPAPADQGRTPAAPRDAADPQKTLAEIIDEVPDDQLRQVLTTLHVHAADDRARFVAAVGAWFDDAMDRLSGWYKRYTQAISVAVALVVCIVLNADALRIGSALWRTPALTAELHVQNEIQVSQAIDALGAPFWFDTLQRFVQLAGTGPAGPTDAKGSRPSARAPGSGGAARASRSRHLRPDARRREEDMSDE